MITKICFHAKGAVYIVFSPVLEDRESLETSKPDTIIP